MAKKKRKADVKPKKGRGRAADFDDDEDDLDEAFDDEDDFASPPKPSRNDAYTGMLVIGLLSLVAATVFLMLDAGDMTATALTNPNVTVPALAGPTAAAAPPTGL